MSREDHDEAWTDDAVLDGRLRLKQPRRGHRFGHDAILLAAATGGRAGEHAVELGAGVGAAGLALAWRVEGLRLTLIEIDPLLAAAARVNADRNGLGDRIATVALDVMAPPAVFAANELGHGIAHRVLMNPPFHDPATQPPSPDPDRRQAHAAERGVLAHWTRTASRLLRPEGVLTVIHPADRLADILTALDESFGAVAILPVYGKPRTAAIRLLVRAVKESRGPLTILPPLVLNDERGKPTADAEAVLRAGAALPLAAD
ncbi:MAG: methyltransferase [Bradyrhizobiaceae bacterium]|nr:methyltransferase [Bradyrhizobiaceae bacterium]